MYLLDTNVISELRKPPSRVDDEVAAWAARQHGAHLYLSAMTIYELELGVRRMERRDPVAGRALRRWLDGQVRVVFAGRVLAVDDDVAREAACLQVPDPRPERDCLIAATARVHGLTVVTHNVKDFRAIDTPVLNPWKDSDKERL